MSVLRASGIVPVRVLDLTFDVAEFLSLSAALVYLVAKDVQQSVTDVPFEPTEEIFWASESGTNPLDPDLLPVLL
jgi:hypothetical protein